MRKTIVGALLLSMASAAQAQSNIYEVNGNVGIGTANPTARLNINTTASDSISSSLKLGIANDAGNINVPVGGITGAYNIDFATWRDMVPDQVGARIRAERVNAHLANAAYVQAMDLAFYTSDGWWQQHLSEKLRIKYNGNVGIGLSNPEAKLHVSGQTKLDGVLYIKDAKPGSLGNKWGIYCWDNHFEISKRDANYDYQFSALSVLENGNIGMGIPPASVPAGYKLSVAGKILSEELRVKLQSTWPDYVFKASYQLMPLNKIEAFIKTNGHLPEVPSAKEVEEKGIEVGANQALLLKKIEELTLHLIQLEKKLAQQNEQIQQQQELINKKFKSGKIEKRM